MNRCVEILNLRGMQGRDIKTPLNRPTLLLVGEFFFWIVRAQTTDRYPTSHRVAAYNRQVVLQPLCLDLRLVLRIFRLFLLLVDPQTLQPLRLDLRPLQDLQNLIPFLRH